MALPLRDLARQVLLAKLPLGLMRERLEPDDEPVRSHLAAECADIEALPDASRKKDT